jgi:hypothetical protein
MALRVAGIFFMFKQRALSIMFFIARAREVILTELT